MNNATLLANHRSTSSQLHEIVTDPPPNAGKVDKELSVAGGVSAKYSAHDVCVEQTASVAFIGNQDQTLGLGTDVYGPRV